MNLHIRQPSKLENLVDKAIAVLHVPCFFAGVYLGYSQGEGHDYSGPLAYLSIISPSWIGTVGAGIAAGKQGGFKDATEAIKMYGTFTWATSLLVGGAGYICGLVGSRIF